MSAEVGEATSKYQAWVGAMVLAFPLRRSVNDAGRLGTLSTRGIMGSRCGVTSARLRDRLERLRAASSWARVSGKELEIDIR